MIKGLPRGPSSYNQNSNGVEAFGLLEVRGPKEAEDDATTATEAQADAAAPSVLQAKREVVRFTTESVVSSADEASDAAEEKEQKPRSKGKRNQPTIPVFGDEVQFRVAIHRKTGRKRAVDLVITCSAKAKLEQVIDAKLATMTREQGMVDCLKSGGGFIRCCDRPEDVYFPMHELRADDEEETAASSPPDDKNSPRRNSRSSKNRITVREGDEVSFFVYEDHDDENASGRSRPRLTALRVHKLPSGTVSFEEMLRANIEGVITKAPKEPRNAPEVMGVITPDTPSSVQSQGDEAEAAAQAPTSSNSKKKGKGPKPGTLVFRRSDTQEMSYAPLAGDRVLLDEVLDKRTRKMKAVNVRVLQLNPKNRTQGVISSVKEEFGFIKLVDRTADAFFRFSDVMSSHRDFRVDTEVAFDVSPGDGGKSDNLRATRVELLPAGSIQWESVLEQGLEGVILSVPSSSSSNSSRRNFKQSAPQNGRIRWTAPSRHLIDFLPELKEQIDAVFLTQEMSKRKKKDVSKDEENKATEDTAESSRRELVLPSSLSKFERAALHEYCDWLGIEHGSVDVRPGSGALQRQLQLSSPGVVANKPIDTENGQVPEIILDFKLDDVTEVRYDPRVGDRVSFTLAQIKRTKQFACKSVVLLEAAAVAPRSANATEKKKAAELPTGEGVIAVLKSEGFGFIEPVPTGAAQDLTENLFFHIKEVTSGETLEQLKEGMEVTFRMQYDEKKKKTRAIGITVVPEGTIKKVDLLSFRGVVTRPSFLQRMKKTGGSARYNKNQPQVSTVGKIRLVATGFGDEDSADVVAEDDETDAADEEGEEKEDSGEDAEKSKGESEAQGDTSAETIVEAESKPAKKKPSRVAYVYHLQDIVDQTVILREGDEVEFLAQVSTGKKGAQRASKIRLVASHAKQGVVTRVQDDGSGVIRIDSAAGAEETAESAESPLEIPFIARNVLRSDVLNEGDRVEFAHVKTPLPGLSNTATAATPTNVVTSEIQDTMLSPPTAVGHATSILRLSSSEEPRRGSRAVNSTLLQAMRQVGATAVAKSRMAKGPDGTRGFPEGWRTSLATTTSA